MLKWLYAILSWVVLIAVAITGVGWLKVVSIAALSVLVIYTTYLIGKGGVPQ